MIFLSKSTRIAVSSFSFLLVLLAFSRCSFSTTVITSSDSPDVVFTDFISALKDKNYAGADAFLADGASIAPVNETGYAFFDDYVAVCLGSLSCASVGKPEYNGTSARVSVSLRSFDRNRFVSWTKDNISGLEHEYMIQHDLKEFDKNDRKAVDQVLSMAVSKFAALDDSARLSEAEINVDFVFSDKKWKIVGNDNLINSIFGGSDDNGIFGGSDDNGKAQEKSEEKPQE